MFDLFTWMNIIFAFLAGGCWIMLVTVASDLFGSRIGGFIGGLPSTVVISFFFIGLTQTPEMASEATTVFPLVCGFTGLFLLSFVYLSRWSFFIGLSGALIIWLILSGIIVVVKLDNFTISFVGYLIILGFSCLMYTKVHLVSAGQTGIRYSVVQIIARGIFGGIMIAFAVFISKASGPVMGGIFSVFPAVFIATIIISYRNHGLDFTRALTRPMFMTGMITLLAYGIAVRYFYPLAGLIWGTVISYAVSMISAGFIFVFIQRTK